ncbi:hypothetical protein, partial [Methylocystis suflitae]|uniref:hypothetical protein n=1 Tax=Methylocystis suflitae TaxID=2951405 RepID=UPI00210EA20E
RPLEPVALHGIDGLSQVCIGHDRLQTQVIRLTKQNGNVINGENRSLVHLFSGDRYKSAEPGSPTLSLIDKAIIQCARHVLGALQRFSELSPLLHEIAFLFTHRSSPRILSTNLFRLTGLAIGGRNEANGHAMLVGILHKLVPRSL